MNVHLSIDICQRTKLKSLKTSPYHQRIPVDYSPKESMSVDIIFMSKGLDNFKYLLVATCEITDFRLSMPVKSIAAHVTAEALICRALNTYFWPSKTPDSGQRFSIYWESYSILSVKHQLPIEK